MNQNLVKKIFYQKWLDDKTKLDNLITSTINYTYLFPVNNNIEKIKLRSMNFPIYNLPNSIRKIKIDTFDLPIRKLPTNIEKIFIE